MVDIRRSWHTCMELWRPKLLVFRGDKDCSFELFQYSFTEIRFAVFDLLHLLPQGDKIYNLQSAPLLLQRDKAGGLNLLYCYFREIRFTVFDLLHLLLQGKRSTIFNLLHFYFREIRFTVFDLLRLLLWGDKIYNL
ncbi:hypothetical protein J1N35_044020 [Gossypium stocksii]|uniref:Uncharacterized protein n=1 Tax=Gossypium stocksii TaxID=47602 RepID=A0A9D3U8Q4_9ROSI|nr:hypothetical protein J1N35_044020 [Gossypium stocksii]